MKVTPELIERIADELGHGSSRFGMTPIVPTVELIEVIARCIGYDTLNREVIRLRAILYKRDLEHAIGFNDSGRESLMLARERIAELGSDTVCPKNSCQPGF